MKYLAGRDTPARRKRFREARQKLQQASAYAREHLTDARGLLNPGLMPQVLDDLRKIAPARTEVDEQLIRRWNRVAEIWRSDYSFRDAVLRYATRDAWRDPASVGLWPEVVYPLIERARWQRRLRSGAEVVIDAVCDNLRLPDAGLRLDRAMQVSVPEPVARSLEVESARFVEEPELDEAPAEDREAERVSIREGLDPVRFHAMASEAPGESRGLIRLAGPDPIRLSLGELHALWREAMAALRAPGGATVQRAVPIGPYRLAVIPSVRGRSAGEVAIQGMSHNKQIELLTPSLRGAGAPSRPIVAAWVYQNQSLVIAHVDFQGQQRFVLWDAADRQQTNFDDPAALNSTLLKLGLEAPDGLADALSKRFRPRNPV